MVALGNIPTPRAKELVVSTEGKTDCKEWGTDGWLGYERVLPSEVDHYIGKVLTQRCSCVPTRFYGSKLDGPHRRQNKFSKLWEQTEATLKLVVSYFNWIWQHSYLGTTAAQRADLAERPWTWNDIATYPTLV